MSLLRRDRNAFAVLGVVAASMSLLAIARGDGSRVRAYLQVVALLVVLMVAADRAARFSRPMVAAMVSSLVVHLIGGLMTPVGDAPTFYETWLVDGVLKFDQAAHLYGTAVLTFACWHLAVGLLQPLRQGAGLAFVAGLMACGLGAINELIEFLFGMNNADFHAGGFTNTGWDLAFNLGGAAVGYGLLVMRERNAALSTAVSRPSTLSRRQS
jgi:uncharacterized membrane protein YjdF